MDCREKTAYCGLYCADCIPGDTRIYESVEQTLALFDEVGMDQYAVHSARKNPLLEQYPQAIAVMNAVLKLRCGGSCRQGLVSGLGCAQDCPIRICVLDKGYDGCWECAEHRECAKLDRLKGFHPSLHETLDTIGAHGIEAWVHGRGPHYPWSAEKDR